MKEMTFEKMEEVNGGGWASMFCNAAGAASIATGVAIEVGLCTTMGPVGFGIVAGIDLACLIYGW